jgi:hypothetical protein
VRRTTQRLLATLMVSVVLPVDVIARVPGDEGIAREIAGLSGTTCSCKYPKMADDAAPQSRKDAALSTVRALINAMEVDEAPIERCLMLAQRVARLMRDTDAQTWLDLEQRGYPADLRPGRLGSCGKYAYRFSNGVVVVTSSLPEIEAEVQGALTVLNKLQTPAVNGTAENYIVAGATQQVMKVAAENLLTVKGYYVSAKTRFASMRGMLHRWAADTLIALELGNAVETIFEAARVDIDKFVRASVPSAAEQLVAVHERMRERTAESFSHALTSCRRLILSVADAVFPPRAQPYIDGRGRQRTVGEDQYKNRLIAFIETQATSGGTKTILDAQVEHLAARLDATYEKACKGVHDDVSESEARLVVLETYILLAEVARYAANVTVAPPSAAQG